jgi:LAO/AO transport system kinase
VASRDEGVEQLLESVEAHGAYLKESGQLAVRERDRAKTEFVALLRDRLLAGALQALSGLGTLDEIAERIARREQDPYALGETLVRQLAHTAPAQ